MKKYDRKSRLLRSSYPRKPSFLHAGLCLLAILFAWVLPGASGAAGRRDTVERLTHTLASPATPPLDMTYRLKGEPAGTGGPSVVASPPRLSLFDISGRRLLFRVLQPLAEGAVGRLAWDGRDQLGQRLSPGVYFVQLSAENERVIRRLVLAH